MRAKIRDRLLRIATTPDGKEALRNLYSIDGLTNVVELSDAQIRQMGIRFDAATQERIVRKGDKVVIPIGDWYFQSIRDAAKYLGLDLTKLAR